MTLPGPLSLPPHPTFEVPCRPHLPRSLPPSLPPSLPSAHGHLRTSHLGAVVSVRHALLLRHGHHGALPCGAGCGGLAGGREGGREGRRGGKREGGRKGFFQDSFACMSCVFCRFLCLPCPFGRVNPPPCPFLPPRPPPRPPFPPAGHALRLLLRDRPGPHPLVDRRGNVRPEIRGHLHVALLPGTLPSPLHRMLPRSPSTSSSIE
jgi:hypothetical protein